MAFVKVQKLNDFFNDHSICIFTDSSFKRNENCSDSYIGTAAPAYSIYHNNVCIYKGFQLIYDATSVQGELYAVLLGVQAAGRYQGYQIRLFSDNQTAICSVRDWIFDWVRETHDGKQTLGPKGRIKNQPIIMNIIQAIIYNNMPIELYHVKGHVNIYSAEKMKKAKDVFIASNYGYFPSDCIDDKLIQAIAIGNNDVDRYSTEMLKMYYQDRRFSLIEPIRIGYHSFNLAQYRLLVNSRNIYY